MEAEIVQQYIRNVLNIHDHYHRLSVSGGGHGYEHGASSMKIQAKSLLGFIDPENLGSLDQNIRSRLETMGIALPQSPPV